MADLKPLFIVAGATAVGKTDFSVRLAKKINGEIISADSMQVYKKMNIGTAKISEDEMCGIKHYLIDELEPGEEFNVYEFQKAAKKYICEIFNKGKIPIIAGGTGFYIQSVLYDIDFTEHSADKTYRAELEHIAATKGNDYLYAMLKEADPESALLIHKNNVKRVIRALEFFHDTDGKISVHNSVQKEKASPYDYTYIILNRERAEIYRRIEKRVDMMIEKGLVQEVRSLLDSGLSRDCLSMQGLGYKETASYLSGEITLNEAVDLIKKNTRHFAKRQITWFKREPGTIWLEFENYGSTDEMIEDIWRKKTDV